MARPTKPDALELAQGNPRLEQAVLRSRQLVQAGGQTWAGKVAFMGERF